MVDKISERSVDLLRQISCRELGQGPVMSRMRPDLDSQLPQRSQVFLRHQPLRRRVMLAVPFVRAAKHAGDDEDDRGDTPLLEDRRGLLLQVCIAVIERNQHGTPGQQALAAEECRRLPCRNEIEALAVEQIELEFEVLGVDNIIGELRRADRFADRVVGKDAQAAPEADSSTLCQAPPVNEIACAAEQAGHPIVRRPSLRHRAGGRPRNIHRNLAEDRHPSQRPKHDPVSSPMGLVQLQQVRGDLGVFPGENRIGLSGFVPLAEKMPEGDDIALMADRIGIEHDPAAASQQTPAEIGVLGPERAVAGEVGVKAAERFEQFAPDGKLTRKQIHQRELGARQQLLCPVFGPFANSLAQEIPGRFRMERQVPEDCVGTGTI
jgi:hypothetical protein